MDASTVVSTGCFRKAPERLAVLAAVLLWAGWPCARAQTAADTTGSAAVVPAPTGTAESSPDSTSRAGLPVRHRAIDAVGLLAGTPGSFTYDFGTAGWPDGWSPRGLDPGSVGLEMAGLPFDDPVTGSPVWEFLPLAQMQMPVLVRHASGRTDVVRTRLRADWPDRPLTEMRYRSAGGGLQSVDATHVQRRRAGESGLLTVVLGYGGAGAIGEYAGSRMRRKRRLLGVARLERGPWTVELGDLANRNRVGAHGGVLPVPGFAYESIYDRLLAGVDEPTAERIRRRNDLWLSVGRSVGESVLIVRPFVTSVLHTYHTSTDTTTTRVRRVGVTGDWTMRVAGWPVDVTVTAFSDAVRSGNAFSEHPDPVGTATVFLASTRTIGPVQAELGLSGGRLAGTMRAGGHAAASWAPGAVALNATAALAHVPRSLADRWGFGGTFTGSTEASAEQVRSVVAGAAVTLGTLVVDLSVFARENRNSVLPLLDASGDTVRVMVASKPVRMTGATLAASLRADRPRGLYAEGSVTWTGRASEIDPAAARARAALPDVYGRLRLGARMLLFSGDLDLDLAVQVRAWAATQGLRLHPQTGLLALPDPAARELPGSAILDLTADARIRSATVFLALENVLSGTTLTPGNQLVPDYPFPERRFRFGVYWPIFD